MNILLVQTASRGEKTREALLSSANQIPIDVIQATTLSEALNQLTGEKFDAIVADLYLPDSQGLDTLTAIRRQIGDRTPTIVIVSSNQEKLALQALASGADDYLLPEKIDGWFLGKLVQQIAQGKNLADQLELTKQQLAQDLENFSERLVQILDLAPDAIISIDTNQKITLFNQGAVNIFGYEPSEAIGQPLDMLLPKHLAAIHRGHIARFQQSGDTKRQMGKSLEIMARRKDGSAFPAEAAISKVTVRQEIILTVILRDITDRKQSEAALEKERQHLRQIVTHAPVAMAMLDRELRYIAYSNQWLIDYQLTSDHHPQISSLEGYKYDDFLSHVPERYQALLQQALQGEVIYLPEDLYQLNDGSKVYRRLALQPWYAADDSIGGVTIASHIINELVEAREAALEIARMKSEFLANMSHEIRTPMNGVLGMTELLDRTALNSQQREFLQTLKSSSDHLLFIINDILDFSKLEAKEMRLEIIEFNLDEFLEETIDLFAVNAHQKGLELVGFVDPNLPRHLKGDPNRLRQIISNLINNAIKFTSAGAVTIEVYPVAEAGNEQITESATVNLDIRVKDTGIGIAPEQHDKLFKAFSQVDASHTREYGGTGLGLAICQQLVKLMGGTIGVESSVGMGSTFWFTVQLAVGETEHRDLLTPPLLREDRVKTLAGKKLLIVDNQPLNRLAIGTQATAWGLEVDEAEDGTIALSKWRSAVAAGHPYDVAIWDWSIVKVNRDNLTQLIEDESTAISPPKLILMTALDRNEIASRVSQMGFTTYLSKPVKKNRLFDCLVHVVNQESYMLVTEQELVEGQTVDEKSTTTQELKTGKILLVEDTPVNRTVALTQLKQLGYEADYVENGQAALDRLASKSYDLVFMDCQMPVLDGYEATRLLREREGDNARTVVVGLTAYAMKGDREQCLAAGMDDYMAKPVKLEQLTEMLEKWMPKQIPSIDFSRLAEISGGDKEFEVQLLEAFIDNTESYLKEIKEARVNSDPVLLAQIAHQIKGSSVNLGMAEMSKIAKQLQVTAQSHQWEMADRLIGELDIYLQQVKADLPQLKQGIESWVPPLQKGGLEGVEGETAAKNIPVESEHQAVESSQSPPEFERAIDRDRLAQISRGNHQFVQQLIAAFIESTATYLQEANAALAANDAETLAHYAHQIKGSAATVGVRLMPEIAASLQQQARQNQLQNAPQLLQELTEILEQVKHLQPNI